MPKKYTLYLDESETHRHDKITNRNTDFYFCMAGVIVADDVYEILKGDVNQLKHNIWPELPDPEQIILHQMRLAEAEKGRLDSVKYPEYVKFCARKERKRFYKELKQIFAHNSLTVIGSSINLGNLKEYYGVQNKNGQDQYLVAMQLLLENYCHFLCNNNAIGRIVYEHRELIGDERLRDRYYHMKLMGSMYMTKETAEKRLLGIDFVDKTSNEAGLQIADFVPNSFARDHAGMKQLEPNIFSTLKYHLYDGNMGFDDRFGVKYMP